MKSEKATQIFFYLQPVLYFFLAGIYRGEARNYTQ